MEENESLKPTTNGSPADGGIVAPCSGGGREMIPSQQSQTATCPTCGSQARSSASGTFIPSFVYALGRIEPPSFPTIGLNAEYEQVRKNTKTEGLSDQKVFYEILRSNRYLARQLCWVFSVRDVPTYFLQPRDPADFDRLMDSVDRDPLSTNMDVVIGFKGPIAPPDMCNGLLLPIVVFDQSYSFDRQSLVQSLPRADGISDKDFNRMAAEVLDKFMLITDNAGNTDEHRAVNYLAVRHSDVYRETARKWMEEDKSFTSIDVRPSRLSGTRKFVDVIFEYTNRKTVVVEKYLVRVDVTEEFPFFTIRWSSYVDL